MVSQKPNRNPLDLECSILDSRSSPPSRQAKQIQAKILQKTFVGFHGFVGFAVHSRYTTELHQTWRKRTAAQFPVEWRRSCANPMDKSIYWYFGCHAWWRAWYGILLNRQFGHCSFSTGQHYNNAITAVKPHRRPHQGVWNTRVAIGNLQPSIWHLCPPTRCRHQVDGLPPSPNPGPIWSSELFRCRALGSRYGHRSSFAVEPRDSSATEPAHWSPNIDQISDSTLGFEPDYGNSIIDNLGSKLRKYFDGHNFKLLLWYRYPGASTSMDINYSEQMTWDDQSTLAWGVRRKVLTESANYGGIGIHKLHQHTSFPPW